MSAGEDNHQPPTQPPGVVEPHLPIELMRDVGLQHIKVPQRPESKGQFRSTCCGTSPRYNATASSHTSSRPATGKSSAPPMIIPIFSLRTSEKISSARRRPSTGSSKISASTAATSRMEQDEPPGSGGVGVGRDDSVSWTAHGPKLLSTSSKASKPVLLQAMETHLRKELAIIGKEGGDDEDGIEALRVYREVLRMFIEGFTTYGPILSKVMGSYDTVIRNLATSEASLRRVANDAGKVHATMSEESEALRGELHQLQEEIEMTKAAQLSITEEKVHDATQAETEIEGLRRELAMVKHERSLDLQKMLLLIKAVKESDRKNRVLSDVNHDAKRKLEELAEVKSQLRDTDEELRKHREDFCTFVPMWVHDELENDLNGRVLSLQTEIKRLRRVCAAKTSQLEGLRRATDQLRDENKYLHSTRGSGVRANVFTPRPHWDEVTAEIPAFEESLKDAYCQDLDDDEVTIVTTAQPTNSGSTVAKVDAMRRLLHDALSANERLRMNMNQIDLLTPNEDSVGKESAVPAKDEGNAHNLKTILRDEEEPPFLGLGVAESVPIFLRTIGTVERKRIPVPLMRKIAHMAFGWNSGIRDRPAHYSPNFDVQEFFASRVKVLLESCPEISKKLHLTTPLAVAYNFLECCRILGPSDPLTFLTLNVLELRVPLRILLDAHTVLWNVQHEVKLLAEQQGKMRQRRGAIMEVVGPFLRYKQQSELDELKTALGLESSVDVNLFTEPDEHPFTTKLLDQECYAGFRLFSVLMHQMTKRSIFSESEACRVIQKSDVVASIVYVEPKTAAASVQQLVTLPSGSISDEDNVVIPLSLVVQKLWTIPIIRVSREGSIF